MTYINPLVVEKINSMDMDENMKDLLVKLFEIEASYGPDPSLKKNKTAQFRQEILKKVHK